MTETLYDLSILSVDGSLFECISKNKTTLVLFLQQYDHEGSSISLYKAFENSFIPVDDPLEIYKELIL